MTIEAWRSSEFKAIVDGADLVTLDGMPLVKSLNLLYGIKQERVAGMDLMPGLISKAAQKNLSIFFYGSTNEVLDKITSRINREYPDLKIAGVYSPPFRELSEREECEIVEHINASGANMVMVALGCPRQEFWMARQKGKISAVMLGLGGAFPVYAGLQKRAPLWMQKCSLEWFYRLCQEPRRLFKRYFVTNSLFILLIIREFIRIRLLRKPV